METIRRGVMVGILRSVIGFLHCEVRVRVEVDPPLGAGLYRLKDPRGGDRRMGEMVIGQDPFGSMFSQSVPAMAGLGNKLGHWLAPLVGTEMSGLGKWINGAIYVCP